MSKKYFNLTVLLKKLTLLLSMTGIILGSSSSSGLPLVPVIPGQGQGNAVTPVTEQKPGVLRKILRGTSQFISKLSSDVHEVPIMDMTTGTMYRPTFPKSASCEDILNELNTLIPGGCNILFYQDKQADRMYAPNSTLTIDPTHNKKDKPLKYKQQATLMVGKKEDQDDYWGELRLCCLRALLQLEEYINNSQGDLEYDITRGNKRTSSDTIKADTLTCIHTFKKACKQKGVRLQIDWKKYFLLLDKEVMFTASLAISDVEAADSCFIRFLAGNPRDSQIESSLVLAGNPRDSQIESRLEILPDYCEHPQFSTSLYHIQTNSGAITPDWMYGCSVKSSGNYKSRYDYGFDINKISDIKVEIRDLAGDILMERNYTNRYCILDQIHPDIVPHLKRMTGGKLTQCILQYEDHGTVFFLLFPQKLLKALNFDGNLNPLSLPTSQKQINFTLIVLNSDR